MTRYSLGVQQVFSAKHYLIGGDFGPESDLHSHDYRVEIIFEGNKLNKIISNNKYIIRIIENCLKIEKIFFIKCS